MGDNTLLTFSEEAICQGVILPVLGLLGWSRDDTKEVFPQDPAGSGRVDYCLKLRGADHVPIEVKRGNEELDRHERQILRYAFEKGTEMAVLTNGIEWWLYLPLHKGHWQDKKFFAVDIMQQGAESAALHLKEFLSRESISDGTAITRANKMLDEREKAQAIAAILPEAWKAFCSEPDEQLLESFADKVESLCGHKPELDRLAIFVRQVGISPIPAESVELTRVEPPSPSYPKAVRVLEILKDGQWHSAPELRKRLDTLSVNPILYSMQEQGEVEVIRSRKGNLARIAQKGKPEAKG